MLLLTLSYLVPNLPGYSMNGYLHLIQHPSWLLMCTTSLTIDLLFIVTKYFAEG